MKESLSDNKGLSRFERILAKILIANMESKSKTEQMVALSECGIANIDIASLLDTTSANVNQQIYMAKKSKVKIKKLAKKGKK